MLEDATVRGLSPEGWASRVAGAAARWNTSQVVAEANNGGMMVQSVLQAADLGLFVRLVHATRGKSARAEPIALKFETGKAYFAGEFAELEAELGGMIAGGGYEGPGPLARPGGRDGVGDDGAERDALRAAEGTEAVRRLSGYDNFLTVHANSPGNGETAIGGAP